MYNNLKHMLNVVLSSRYFYKVLIVAVIANLASLFMVYQNIQIAIKNRSPSFLNLSFGESLDDAVQRELFQQGIDIYANSVHVVVFIDFTQENYKRILSFLEMVKKKHRETGVQFDIIVPVSEERIGNLKNTLSLELNITSDRDGFIYDLLDIRHGDGGIVILNKEKTLQFVLSPLPPEETIRQMVEVSLYGKSETVNNPDKRDQVTKKTLQNLNVYDVVTRNHTTLREGLKPGGNKLITIFDGYCPNCSTFEQRVKTLQQIASMNNEITEVVFLFKVSASEFEIRKLETLNMSFKLYQTNAVLLPELEYMGREEAIKHFRTVLVDSEFNTVYFENHIENDDRLISHCFDALNQDKI